jgi:hypothetical protein
LGGGEILMTRRQRKPASDIRTPIIIAIIGVVGVLGAALIGNWEKIVGTKPESKPPEVVGLDSSVKASPTPQATSGEELIVDLAAVDTATAPGRYVAADPYLLDYGILVSERVPPKSNVVIVNNLGLYRGQSVHPKATQNFLTQVDTGNGPASFTLRFTKPCESVSFTRPMLLAATKSGITHPAWSAHALDEEGRELSSQSEGITESYSNVPERTDTLKAPGFDRIVAVRFDSDPRLKGKPFSAFPAILIERLTMRCKGSK